MAAERKATLRRRGQSLNHEGTPPKMRPPLAVNGAYHHHHGDQERDSECSTEGSPEQEKKVKVPMLPRIARTALQPRSFPPPPPPSANKATPTFETAPPLGAMTKVVDSEALHKPGAPPPVPEKPKKKRVMSFEYLDEPDSAHQQAPPIKLEGKVEDPDVGVATVDMDALMDEATTVETPVKKGKKKVKRKHDSEDGGGTGGRKEKK